MRRLALLAVAAVALTAAGAAVATLKKGDVAQVSATLSATTPTNVETRTYTCDDQTFEVTTGRWSGTATSSAEDLSGTVELRVKSVYNTTKKLGWIAGKLRIRAEDNRTTAHFSGVNVDGKVDGWVRGSAGHRDGVLFGSLTGAFSKTGGFTDGALGAGGGTNAAVIAKHLGCRDDKASRPSVRLLVRGSVEAVSATSISVKPRDGSATQTCAVTDGDDVERIGVGDRVEIACVQAGAGWTLAKARRK